MVEIATVTTVSRTVAIKYPPTVLEAAAVGSLNQTLPCTALEPKPACTTLESLPTVFKSMPACIALESEPAGNLQSRSRICLYDPRISAHSSRISACLYGLESEPACTARDQIPTYSSRTSSCRVLETAAIGCSNQNLPVRPSNLCLQFSNQCLPVRSRISAHTVLKSEPACTGLV